MIKEGDLVFIWNPKKGDSFLIKVQPGQSQGTHFGQIKHSEIMEHNYGEGIRTPKGQVYYLLRPTLGEFTRRIKRQTQIVFPKEAGFIIEHLNIFPGCTVVECGTGSGSLCCTFAHFVGDTGKVCTYDRREEFSALAKKNAELSIQGRHDPCIVPRAAIVQTCAAALAVGDLLTARYGAAWMTHPTSFRKEDE